jgi:hypothetical protein
MVSITKAVTHARMHAEQQLLMLKQQHAMQHACRF